MNKHIKIIGIQAIFILLVLGAVYFAYPKTILSINGAQASFKSVNARVIEISESPDFSESRFIEMDKDATVSLDPGKYYWRASNAYIEGRKNEFTIDSEIAMILQEKENSTSLVNVGNVRLNVTRNKNGMMVGHIILETNEEEIAEDVEYVGREMK